MEKVKSLRELTETEFDALKRSGLLKTIYADAPETYKEIRGKRPMPITNPDFSSLVKLCEQYMDYKQRCERMRDGEYYIFEEAIECVYGRNNESNVWDFINKNS